jgi:Cu(I)/Ag(I) efflux system membrane fusion protein
MENMMKKSTIIALVLAALTAVLPTACSRPAAEAEAAAAEPHEEKAAGTVVLTPAAVAGGGLTFDTVRTIEAPQTITALGELELDARRVAGAAARASGRLEKVAAYVGDRVAAGSVLAEIYSRDYLAVQAEVAQAASRLARLRGQADEPAARDFLEAARRKLAPYGDSPAETDALVASGTLKPLLAVRAPIAGVVLESRAIPGTAVEEGADLFRLADPSTLWASLHLTEKALAFAKPGMEAIIRTAAFPGRDFPGRLVLVGAVMEPAARTIEARVALANPGLALKPGMYVEAVLASVEKRRVLTAASDAVHEFSGGRVVFVRTGETTFVLRPVETGEMIGSRVEIRSGLAEGDVVVAAGSFLIKSELMKASLGDEHGHD